MAKIEIREGSDATYYVFWCPGCEDYHSFRTAPKDGADPKPTWTFNGDLAAPTFSPSLLYPDRNPRCHLFLTGGNLSFCGDCGHALAGKRSVPLPDLPPWME